MSMRFRTLRYLVALTPIFALPLTIGASVNAEGNVSVALATNEACAEGLKYCEVNPFALCSPLNSDEAVHGACTTTGDGDVCENN